MVSIVTVTTNRLYYYSTKSITSCWLFSNKILNTIAGLGQTWFMGHNSLTPGLDSDLVPQTTHQSLIWPSSVRCAESRAVANLSRVYLRSTFTRKENLKRKAPQREKGESPRDAPKNKDFHKHEKYRQLHPFTSCPWPCRYGHFPG